MTSASPDQQPRNLLRQPVHPDITEEMVRDLVHAFYDRIRVDTTLGPIFERVIAGRWDTHLSKMCDFWSSVMLVSGRYKGRPLPAHLKLKELQPAHFSRWLELFRETAEEVCPADVATIFAERSRRIAESFQLAIFFRPDDPSSMPPVSPDTRRRQVLDD
ncbi:MAG: group III truncated hemoglobin [Kiloniellaceae bacterium]